ncbi:hypothetical protein EVAR_44128_1 [Eumeta japonica]|uniref:Uncharacterized protein n=1 Tax=Eumeta variegata TaxID=151549 RepID=A0A4C1XPB3_EUMVA|nr:hypothetical protein EVAR_44128_1 [Eumeta japonica]
MLEEMLRAEAASVMEHCALPDRRLRIQISDIHSCGDEEQNRKSRPDEDGIGNGTMVGIGYKIKIRTKSMFGIGVRAGLLNPNLLNPRPGSELKARLRSKSKELPINFSYSRAMLLSTWLHDEPASVRACMFMRAYVRARMRAWVPCSVAAGGDDIPLSCHSPLASATLAVPLGHD